MVCYLIHAVWQHLNHTVNSAHLSMYQLNIAGRFSPDDTLTSQAHRMAVPLKDAECSIDVARDSLRNMPLFLFRDTHQHKNQNQENYQRHADCDQHDI